MFSSLYSPKNHKYAACYSAVLLTVIIPVVIININLINLSPIEKGALIFEGYFSLFMLVHDEKVGKAFFSHLSPLNNFLNLKY